MFTMTGRICVLVFVLIFMAGSPLASGPTERSKSPDLAACQDFLSAMKAAAKAKDQKRLKTLFPAEFEQLINDPKAVEELSSQLEMVELVEASPRLAGVSIMMVRIKGREGDPLPLFAVRAGRNGKIEMLSKDQFRFFFSLDMPLELRGIRSIPFEYDKDRSVKGMHDARHLWIYIADDKIRFRIRYEPPLSQIHRGPKEFGGPNILTRILLDQDNDPATGYWGKTLEDPISVPGWGYRIRERLILEDSKEPGMDHALMIRGELSGEKWQFKIEYQRMVRDLEGKQFKLETVHRVKGTEMTTEGADLLFYIPTSVLGWKGDTRVTLMLLHNSNFSIKFLPVEYAVSFLKEKGTRPAEVSRPLLTELSAEVVFRKDREKGSGKFYFKRDKYRMDTTGEREYVIIRADRNLLCVINPEEKSYFQIRYDQMQGPPWAALWEIEEAEVTRKLLRSETVGGRTAQKYEVTIKKDKETERVYEWMAADTNYIIKQEAADGSWTIEYSNIRKSAPDNLFEIPAGFKKKSPFTGPGMGDSKK